MILYNLKQPKDTGYVFMCDVKVLVSEIKVYQHYGMQAVFLQLKCLELVLGCLLSFSFVSKFVAFYRVRAHIFT